MGPPWMNQGPAAKSLDFKRSSRRLIGMLRPERPVVFALLLLGVIGVAMSVIGPKILGQATDQIFKGAIGTLLGHDPRTLGHSNAEVVAALRAGGQGTFADVVQTSKAVPGVGIDFTAVGQILLLVLMLYVMASLFMYLQGRLTTLVVQRTVYRLREQVELKLSRLPLKYFDQQPRGEILSRVTNDIDNLAQSLQQTMSQLVTSVLTVVGVLGMMFWISPLLAVIALVTVPVSVVVAAKIGKKAQPQFIMQWSTTGKLNGHIEEMFTGHSLVKAFGRQDESAEVFAGHNEKLYGASYRAQFVSGLIQPVMMFIGNLNYVFVAVIGGLRVASGALSIGDVQAFIQYSRQFSQPLTQVASMANLLQSGVASAERVFELLDAPEQSEDPVPAQSPGTIAGRVAFEDV
ncbi:MAG TPA: ABC transporter ATP-binding protein, partial [Thermoanaerobaculia bacterium]